MENPSYIALSHQMALRRQMDVIATNIANSSTPSFKAERLMFEEMVAGKAPYPASGGPRRGLSFVNEAGMLRDVTDGGMIQTGNTLDLAINGSGYFVVETPAGPRYTRNGNFRLDQDGRVVTSDGYALLDGQNRPIQVRPGETRIEISAKGAVTTETGEVGRIRVVAFEDEQALRKMGSGLYDTDQDPQPAGPGTDIRQGMVEGSNVKSVAEVTTMMEVLRRYQSAQKIIDSEHELHRRAIEKLSRVS
jgi:flagellar basal-body rod protein FlgF